MVNYYITAKVENDPVETLTNRLTQYLTKEKYKLTHQQENYVLFTRKKFKLIYTPLPMENNASIRIDLEKKDSVGNYTLSLHLAIDAEILPKEEENYWNAFVKSLEELIATKQTLSKEHHEIKEKYFTDHPYLLKQKIPKFSIAFVGIFLFYLLKAILYLMKNIK